SLAVLTSVYGGIRTNAGAVREFLELASEATRLADRTDDAAGRAGGRTNLCYALFLTGHLAESVAVTDEGLEIVAGDAELGIDLFGERALTTLNLLPGWALTLMGRLPEAENRLAVGLRLAREHGPLESLSWAHVFHVFMAEATGEARRALRSAQAALEAAESAGAPQALATVFGALGVSQTLAGEWERAIEACGRSLTIMKEKGVALETEAYTLATLARAHLGRGDVTRAEALADEAAALARRQGTLACLCAANLVRARPLVARDGPRAASDIEAILTEAEQLVARTGARIHLPTAHPARAELARLAGDEAARHRELSEAHRLFTEMGATVRAEQVARELAA